MVLTPLFYLVLLAGRLTSGQNHGDMVMQRLVEHQKSLLVGINLDGRKDDTVFYRGHRRTV